MGQVKNFLSSLEVKLIAICELLKGVLIQFQLSPDDLNCLLYKANCYVKTQRYSEAIADADRTLFLYIDASRAQVWSLSSFKVSGQVLRTT